MVSYIGTALNLFNMIPIRPLDGGRITQVIGSWFKYIGITALLWLTLATKDPGLLIIWIVVLDELDWKSLWHKLYSGVTLELLMLSFMIAGYGDKRWLLICLDVILATGFNFLFWYRARNAVTEEDEASEKERKEAPLNVRIKWLIYYFLLLGFLIGGMILQSRYLPDSIKNQKPKPDTKRLAFYF